MASPGCNDCNHDSERGKLLTSATYYGSGDSHQHVAPGNPPQPQPQPQPQRLGGGRAPSGMRRKRRSFAGS
ncbi:hypothetical protein ANANG_G00296940 [Anguilla anguilla]|uniref:Uncharacterized protein n=1 Tax=Anguilla anguilla TaxID=7936 RepID=A0A9D3LUN3_ANGAN|nr:hypothetical protein ANANG_G00296940 [Anguilla anguilla]